MSNQTYMKVLGGVTVVWVAALLLIEPFAQLIEGLMLLFLSTNAR